MIIGGYWSDANNVNNDSALLDSVELFGCSDNSNSSSSISLPSFPGGGIYLTAGAFIPTEEKVLVCGGYGCSSSCGARRECFSWSPASPEVWRREPPLKRPRWLHFMAMVAKERPVVLGGRGGGEITEVLEEAGGWRSYRNLSGGWFSLAGCLAHNGGRVYSLGQDLVELKLASWKLSRLPAGVVYKGGCAVAKAGGKEGIFVRSGHWLDLRTLTWHLKATPPSRPSEEEEEEQALWSFRGRPTVFGSPRCNGSGSSSCSSVEVAQYSPEADRWEAVGRMRRPRTYHEVVEVPGFFCEAVQTRLLTGGEAGAAAVLCQFVSQYALMQLLAHVVLSFFHL